MTSVPTRPPSPSSPKSPEEQPDAAPTAMSQDRWAERGRLAGSARRVTALRRNHRSASAPPAVPPAPSVTPPASLAIRPAAATTPSIAVETPPGDRGRPGGRWRTLLLSLLAIVALVASGVVAYLWWEDSSTYVTTDNAQIDGYMIKVGPLNTGRVVQIRYDVGDRVRIGDVIAQIDVPLPTSETAAGASRLQYTGTINNLVDVKSTVSGVVVARQSDPGDVVSEGQTLLSVVDPGQLWVMANVEEAQIRRVQVGQPVDVYVDVLDAHFDGRVVAITQASAASFSPVPQQNTTANYTRVAQILPVKVALTRPDPRLSLGTSATVKIRVRE